MWQTGEYKVSGTFAELARLTRSEARVVEKAVAELHSKRVCGVYFARGKRTNGDEGPQKTLKNVSKTSQKAVNNSSISVTVTPRVTLTSRRLRRNANRRQGNTLRKRRQRGHGDVT